VGDIKDFVDLVVAETGAHPLIIFGSGLHGSGRSFLADLTRRKFEEMKIPVERMSAGKMFRDVAEEQGLSIDEFAELQANAPDKFYSLNLSVDITIHESMWEKSQEGVVVVDSNLAAYHAETPNAYTILVHAKPEVVGDRVYRAKRRGDAAFSSPEDALRQMVERTREDVHLYRQLSSIARDNFWKMVYRVAAGDMESILESVLRKEVPKSPFFHKTIDNSGSPENAWKQVEELFRVQR